MSNNRTLEKPLTDVQLLFRDVYLSTGSVAIAADKVGKTRQWGYLQVKLPYIAEGQEDRTKAIAKLREETPSGLDLPDRPIPTLKLTRDVDRKAWLEGVILGEILETSTIKDPKTGEEYEVERPFPAAVRAKCMQLLGLMSGDYVVKTENKNITEETVTFVQIANGRGPVPELPTTPKSLPEDAETYLPCNKCGEMIEEKKHGGHEKTCPGA